MSKGSSGTALDHRQRHNDKFTPAQVIAALSSSAGIIALAARKLRCSRTTIYHYLERYPEIAAAAEQADELLAMMAGEPTLWVW